jgi:hypothetical protein
MNKKLIKSIIIITVAVGIFIYFLNQNKIIINTFKQEDVKLKDTNYKGFTVYTCYYFNSIDDRNNAPIDKNLLIGGYGNNYFMSINGQMVEFKKNNDKWIGGNYELQINEKYAGVATEADEFYYEMSGTINIINILNNKSISRNYVGFCSP